MNDRILALLHGPEEIRRAVLRIAASIDRDAGDETVVVVAALKGSFIFLADLLRSLKKDVLVDFVQVRSYGSGTTPGRIELVKNLELPLRGRGVLIVDDMVDTGWTLEFLLRHLSPAETLWIRTCVLLDKPSRRRVEVPVDYRGFTVPDEFVVGYGLDFGEKYRGLPGIYTLRDRSD